MMTDCYAHTRAELDGSPDYCAGCSARLQEWVRWPCVAAVAETEWQTDPAGPDLARLVGTLRAATEAARLLAAERRSPWREKL